MSHPVKLVGVGAMLLACACAPSETEAPPSHADATGACTLVAAPSAADTLGSEVRKSEEAGDGSIGVLGCAYYGAEFGPVLHIEVTRDRDAHPNDGTGPGCVPVAAAGVTGSVCSSPEGASAAVVRAAWEGYRLEGFVTRTDDAPPPRDQLINGLQSVVADVHARLTAESFETADE